MAANIIKHDGILSELHGQTKGVLLHIEPVPTRNLHANFVSLFKTELPRGTCLICVYDGDKRIPFLEVKGYRPATWRNLEKRIGQEFTIDYPAKEKQVEIELVNEEA